MADVAFYNRMAATALRLIESKGRDDLVMKRKTAASYDADNDVEVPGVELSQPLKCIVLPASKGAIEAFDNRVENGTLIEANLRQLKIAAKDMTFEPKSGDTVEFEGSKWTALGCTPINPAGVPLVYTVTVKRG